MFWFQVLIPNSWFYAENRKKKMITWYLTHVISYSWQFHCVCIHFPQLIFSFFYLFKTTLCFWAAAVQLCSNSTSALLLSSRHRLTAASQSLLRGSHLCPSTELAAYETLGNTSDSKCFLLSRWASMKSIFKREWCRCHDDEEMFPTLKGGAGGAACLVKK